MLVVTVRRLECRERLEILIWNCLDLSYLRAESQSSLLWSIKTTQMYGDTLSKPENDRYGWIEQGEHESIAQHAELAPNRWHDRVIDCTKWHHIKTLQLRLRWYNNTESPSPRQAIRKRKVGRKCCVRYTHDSTRSMESMARGRTHSAWGCWISMAPSRGLLNVSKDADRFFVLLLLNAPLRWTHVFFLRYL